MYKIALLGSSKEYVRNKLDRGAANKRDPKKTSTFIHLSSQFIITMNNIPIERNWLPISNYGFVSFNLFIVDITLSSISDGISFTGINQKSLFHTVNISNSVLDPPRQKDPLQVVKNSVQVFKLMFFFLQNFSLEWNERL